MLNIKRNWYLYLFFILILVLEISTVFSTKQLSYPETYSNLVKALDKESGVHQGFYLFLKAILYLLNTLNLDLSTQVQILKAVSVALSFIFFVLMYALITQFSDDDKKSFFSLLLFASSPVFYLMTLNTLLTESFVLILILMTLNSWINSITAKKATIGLILLVSLLVISSPLSAFFIIVIYAYLILHLFESKKVLNFEKDIAIYSTFLYATYYIFFFRNYMLNKNLPIIIQEFLSPISLSFTHINISYIVPLVGPTTILFGIYALYSELSSRKKSAKRFYILASMLIVSFVLLIFRVSNAYFLLFLLVISLSVGSARALTLINSFFMKSRFSDKAKDLFLTGAIILNMSFAAVYLPQAIITNTNNAISPQLVKFFEKINNVSETPLRIVSCRETAFLIDFYTKHNGMYERLSYNDKLKVKEIYHSPLELNIVDFLKKHDGNCIVVSEFEKELFNVEKLKAVDLDMLKLKANISNNLLYCLENEN